MPLDDLVAAPGPQPVGGRARDPALAGARGPDQPQERRLGQLVHIEQGDGSSSIGCPFSEGKQATSLVFVVSVRGAQRFQVNLGVDARGLIANFSPQELVPTASPVTLIPALAPGWVAQPVTFDAGGVSLPSSSRSRVSAFIAPRRCRDTAWPGRRPQAPGEVPGISAAASYALGLASVLLLFASILAHEFGTRS